MGMSTGSRTHAKMFHIPLDKPAVFLANCPAVVTHSGDEDDRENHRVNQLEYSVPVYSEGYARRGCSLVRAMKIPAGVGAISHDSSVGAKPASNLPPEPWSLRPATDRSIVT